ncbi:MAG: helix-turn-helix domain containing protein, partial [Bacteroidetes bacterium]|nr:helix-turn-helix domain containing protein [Bacteroidota bacterium]
MTSALNSTEEHILQAARKVFARKGLDGARMQEIADEAGINKALLHYYFRSKDNLFRLV